MGENFFSDVEGNSRDSGQNVTDAYGAEGGKEIANAASASTSGVLADVTNLGAGIASLPQNAAEKIAAGRMPAVLKPTGLLGMLDMILFDFNPEKITLSRSPRKDVRVTAANHNPKGGEKVVLAFAPSKLTINSIIFEGLSTKWKCDTLLKWCSPEPSMPFGGFTSDKLTDPPQTLTFMWGPPLVGFMYTVTMDSVNISYERFTAMGIPIRASVNLQMTEEYDFWTSLATNPTSGGLPERREHTVIQGDNLQAIALRYYGTPSAWRPLAEVNKIDDPLRIYPGQRIFIPNSEELPKAPSRGSRSEQRP